MVENPSHEIVHCDGAEQPRDIDVSRVNRFYGQGQLSEWTTEVVLGTIGVWYWKDDSWVEYAQEIQFFKWNGVGWDWLVSENYYDRIGVHRSTDYRILSKNYDRVQRGTGPGCYIACGRPWYQAYAQYGTWTCGPWVELT